MAVSYTSSSRRPCFCTVLFFVLFWSGGSGADLPIPEVGHNKTRPAMAPCSTLGQPRWGRASPVSHPIQVDPRKRTAITLLEPATSGLLEFGDSSPEGIGTPAEPYRRPCPCPQHALSPDSIRCRLDGDWTVVSECGECDRVPLDHGCNRHYLGSAHISSASAIFMH